MTLIRCVVCEGRKRLMGIGGMIKECYACEGIGYIRDISMNENDRRSKKSGRPRKGCLEVLEMVENNE